MAPRFAPGDEIIARDADGREVACRVRRADDGRLVEVIIGDCPPRPYEAREPMIFPVEGARLRYPGTGYWQHPDGLVIFAGTR